MDLVHDLLDSQVFDKAHMPIGRVDGVVLQLRDGAPPRVSRVELGGAVLARRLHPRLARWAARVRTWWGDGPRESRPTCIPVTALRRNGPTWRVDEIDRRDTTALQWELWLRTNVIARVPGGGK